MFGKHSKSLEIDEKLVTSCMLQIAEYKHYIIPYTNGAFSVLHACGMLTADHVLPAHAHKLVSIGKGIVVALYTE